MTEFTKSDFLKLLTSNDLNMDLITAFNGIWYFEFVFMGKNSIAARQEIPFAIYDILVNSGNKEVSSHDVERYLGTKPNSIYQIINRMCKAGIIKKDSINGPYGAAIYSMNDRVKCRELLNDIYRSVEKNAKIFRKDELEAYYRALSDIRIGLIGNMYTKKLADLLMYFEVFIKRNIVEANNAHINVMPYPILMYLYLLKKVNTFNDLHEIMPYQSISNIREHVRRMQKAGLVTKKETDNAVMPVLVPTEEGIDELTSFVSNLNMWVDTNLSSCPDPKRARMGFAAIANYGIDLISRSRYDTMMPEKRDHRAKNQV